MIFTHVMNLGLCLTAVLGVNIKPSLGKTIDHRRPLLTGSSIITRDVVIIGGGATGTYSAINLKDNGKSVVIVEKRDRLGGHTNTYTDPTTGLTQDYGVVYYHTDDVVRDFFTRMKVPTALADPNPHNSTRYVDLSTGQEQIGYSEPNITAEGAALLKYVTIISNYSYLSDGYYLPDPVPAELLEPFGTFVEKYGLGDMMHVVNLWAEGHSNLLAQTTLHVLKAFSLATAEETATGYLAAAGNNNSALYLNATAELGSDVLFNSEILLMSRSNKGVFLEVKTPSGLQTIFAKKIVVTAPPMLSSLTNFDLSPTEYEIFSKFNASYYYTGLLNHTGIPAGVEVDNTIIGAPYGVPPMPSLYWLAGTTIPNIYDVKYCSLVPLSEEEVRATIIKEAEMAAGIFSGTSSSDSAPYFVAYDDHSPYALTPSADEIADGFYSKLYALQGQRSTYWTGAAWHEHDSGALWQFTKANVIEPILKDD